MSINLPYVEGTSEKLRHILRSHKLILIAAVKLYYLITLISRIAQLLLTQVRKFYCFCQICIFSLDMREIMIYVPNDEKSIS